MVEVFKTNVQEASTANKIISLLLQQFPCCKINFDLHDCDKILRVEGKDFIVEKVMRIVTENGFCCNVLD